MLKIKDFKNISFKYLFNLSQGHTSAFGLHV